MRSDYGVIEVSRVTSEVVVANNEDVALASRGALAPESNSPSRDGKRDNDSRPH
jgi:hypothetical protein